MKLNEGLPAVTNIPPAQLGTWNVSAHSFNPDSLAAAEEQARMILDLPDAGPFILGTVRLDSKGDSRTRIIGAAALSGEPSADAASIRAHKIAGEVPDLLALYDAALAAVPGVRKGLFLLNLLRPGEVCPEHRDLRPGRSTLIPLSEGVITARMEDQTTGTKEVLRLARGQRLDVVNSPREAFRPWQRLRNPGAHPHISLGMKPINIRN